MEMTEPSRGLDYGEKKGEAPRKTNEKHNVQGANATVGDYLKPVRMHVIFHDLSKTDAKQLIRYACQEYRGDHLSGNV